MVAHRAPATLAAVGGRGAESLAALESHAAEQQRQIDDIELQTAQAGATLAKLRSQRDLLRARLRSAEARQRLETARPRSSRRRRIVLVAIAGIVALVASLLIALKVFRSSSPQPSRGTGVSRAESDRNASRLFARTPSPRETPSPAVPEAVAHGDIIVNSIGMHFVRIPAGEFTMATPRNEMDVLMANARAKPLLDEEHGPNECPAHIVLISQPFYMGIHEVTQGEFLEVMGTNPSRFSPPVEDVSRFPVDTVSSDDAYKFRQRLSQLPAEKAAGRTYRLPTEAEWEYACRAGTTGAFSFSEEWKWDTINLQNMNHLAWPQDPRRDSENKHHTTMVGTYPCNAFGLYDMHGNVWEWCSDFYQADYYRKTPSTDPKGPISGARYVIRGGAFDVPAILCRSAFRGHDQGDGKPNLAIGFRLVCEVSEAGQQPDSGEAQNQ